MVQASLWEKEIKIGCAFLMLLPFLSGCWDSQPIDKRSTILGIAVDKAKPHAKNKSSITNNNKVFRPPNNKNLIRLTAQIAVPGRLPLGAGKSGGGGQQSQKPVWVVSVVGHTMDDAMLHLQQQLAAKIFLGHLRIVVISQDIAKKGLRQINDYLRREPNIRRTVWLVAAKHASAIMNVAPPLEKIPTLYMTSIMKQAVEMGKIPPDYLGVFWSVSTSKGANPMIPYIKKKSNNVKIAGMAMFKEDHMVGMMNPFQVGLYMAIKGVSPGGTEGFVPVKGYDNEVLVHSLNRRSKIFIRIHNGRPQATVKVHLTAEIKETSNSKMSIGSSAKIKKIERINSHQLDQACLKFIKKMQKRGVDIFGFGEYVRAKHPVFWNQHVQTKSNWLKMYKEMPVEIQTKVHIIRAGVQAK